MIGAHCGPDDFYGDNGAEVEDEFAGGWAVQNEEHGVLPIEGEYGTEAAATEAARAQGLEGRVFNIYE